MPAFSSLRPLTRCAAVAAMTALPLAASAHVGADGSAHHGFSAGLAHPFTGLDHLAAMAAVGLWSGLTLQGARRWAAPASFAALLLCGALMAAAGLQLPVIEPMIAVSLLVIGLLVATARKLPAAVMATLVGAFALFHGAAHGQELVGAAALAGMVAATVALHAAGLAAGAALQQHGQGWVARFAGLAVGGFGLVTLFA